MQAIRMAAATIVLVIAGAWNGVATAAERADYENFLKVTGFDVSITSMQQGAMSGPGVTGDAPDAFGLQYTALAKKVFDPQLMLDRAIEMMGAVMPDDLLSKGQAFYASALGQRIVQAENASHMAPDDQRYAEGQKVLDDLSANDMARVDDYGAMMDAIGGIDSSVRAVEEIQVRYLLAAMAAGTEDFNYSEQDLRALVKEQEPQIRKNIAVYSMLTAAYAYRDFTDAEVHAYREALEQPAMRQVYEILNAVQFEVMAERYEALAAELAKLQPQQSL